MRGIYKTMRVTAFLSFLFFANLIAFGQTVKNFVPDPNLMFEEVIVKNSDFSLTNVHSIFQSSDGYIWLGSGEGVVRYDGYDYEYIEKDSLSVQINCFLEDENKDIWVGSNSGLYKIRNKKIIPFPNIGGLDKMQINSIFRSKNGVIWIAALRGLYKYENGKIDTMQFPFSGRGVETIAEDQNGVLWIGTAGNGIYLIKDNKVITRIREKDGLPSRAIVHIIVDSKNNAWVATKRSLIKFTDYKFQIFDQNDGIDNQVINYVYEDRKSNIWIATEGGLFLQTGTGFKKFSFNEGLSNDLVYCLYEDRENNLYVGVHSNVLNKLRVSRLKIFNTRHGLSSSWIWSILQDSRGDIWVGTHGNGVDRISKGKVFNYSIKNGLPGNYIRTIGEDKNGDIWLGTNLYGICHLKNGKIKIFHRLSGIAGNTIRVIYSDKKGNLWIGTSTGLTKYDFTKFTNYTTKDGLSNNVVRCITEDKDGKILIGTSKGMSVFHNNKFTNYSMKDGLSDDLVFSIEVDSSNAYWIGTYNNGFNRMKDGKIFQFTTKDGLINKIVYQIFLVNHKYFVVSCNIGIYSINLKDLNDIADGKSEGPLRLIVYEKEQGSSALECNGGNQPSGYQFKNGDIWIATLNGVAALNPEKTRVNDQPPLTSIKRVAIDNKFIDLEDVLNVPSGSDLLKIEFSALSFSNPKKNRYKYIVEGLDKEWIDIGSQNQVYLTNLPYGNYKFKVISCNNDAVWNYEPAVLELIIRPYFYQTKWFIFAVIVLLIGSGFAVFRIRMNSMKKRETELINLVNERTNNLLESEKMVKSLIDSKEKFFSIITHDMKNLFTALLFYSKELYQNYMKIPAEKTSDYIERINQSATSLFELFNNLLIWSKIQTGTLEFKSDRIDLYPVIMSAYNSFADYSKRKNLKLDNKISPNQRVMMDRNMLLMIMNNLIFNALKLAKSDSFIRVYSEDIDQDIIKISVENVGIHLKKEELDKIFNDRSVRNISNTQNEWSTALGLLLCKELIEKNKGVFSVDSHAEKGNIISFTVPKG